MDQRGDGRLARLAYACSACYLHAAPDRRVYAMCAPFLLHGIWESQDKEGIQTHGSAGANLVEVLLSICATALTNFALAIAKEVASSSLEDACMVPSSADYDWRLAWYGTQCFDVDGHHGCSHR